MFRVLAHALCISPSIVRFGFHISCPAYVDRKRLQELGISREQMF